MAFPWQELLAVIFGALAGWFGGKRHERNSNRKRHPEPREKPRGK